MKTKLFALAALLLAGLVAPAALHAAPPAGALAQLTPQNSQLLLIDHQPQMGFGVQSHDRATLVNNVTGLAKASKAFAVPTVLTTVAAKSFSGPIWAEIADVYPTKKIYDRTSMNTWDDAGVVAELATQKATRPKLVMAGLWTEVCIVMPALQAKAAGYEVYIVTDACGGTSKEAHDMAIARLVQAGCVPVTWIQVMLEWQRDWARQETYDVVNDIVKQHGGAYGMGIRYAKEMFNAQEGGKK
ncbi:MAG: hydrolase [Burkholderiales bacterium]|nr:hydrolase [Opitutaceae bacterium]